MAVLGGRGARWAAGVSLALAASVMVPVLSAAEERVGPAALTDGIDVGTTQASLDFAAAKAQGKQFAVVKAGGSQLASGPYVSPHYTRQVDAARAAGVRVGHYWVVGDFQTPVQAADYFVDHLRGYRTGDIIALDNEVLDDSTRLWSDAQSAEWFARVRARVGDIVPWFYLGAADLRGGNWPRTIATGAKLWVAMYGANNGAYPGEPDLGGKYPDWAAHQFTSVGSAGGMSPVDLTVAKPGAFDLVTGPPPTTTPPTGDLPKTSTEQDGVPGTVFWQRTQNWLRIEAGYTGPVDGAPGPATHAALQRALAAGWGYTGPIDGVPGTRTYAAWQRLAAQHGYTGPIDGVMGPHSWRGVARFLNQDRWD